MEEVDTAMKPEVQLQSDDAVVAHMDTLLIFSGPPASMPAYADERSML